MNLGRFKSLTADVIINADLSEFTWIDFHRASEIMERGREAGEIKAAAVLSAMQQRLAPLAYP